VNAIWQQDVLRKASPIPDARDILDQYFLEMRWRCLSLAADLDRVQRAAGGADLLQSDPRLVKLRKAIGVLLEPSAARAERVQDTFTDHTPPPPYDRKSSTER
jgi:hypothetical protein